MLFIINLAFNLNGNHPLHSDLHHLVSLSTFISSFWLEHYNKIKTFSCYPVQGRLFVLLMVLCMEKALWFTMMRKEKMDYLLDYQSRVLLLLYEIWGFILCFQLFLIRCLQFYYWLSTAAVSLLSSSNFF